MGQLISLTDVDPTTTFLGGLDQKGSSGKYTYLWKDEVMQVIFHIATMMPKDEKDPDCNHKKRHIGNDYVCIVYNESGEEYKISTLKVRRQGRIYFSFNEIFYVLYQ